MTILKSVGKDVSGTQMLMAIDAEPHRPGEPQVISTNLHVTQLEIVSGSSSMTSLAFVLPPRESHDRLDKFSPGGFPPKKTTWVSACYKVSGCPSFSYFICLRMRRESVSLIIRKI